MEGAACGRAVVSRRYYALLVPSRAVGRAEAEVTGVGNHLQAALGLHLLYDVADVALDCADGHNQRGHHHMSWRSGLIWRRAQGGRATPGRVFMNTLVQEEARHARISSATRRRIHTLRADRQCAENGVCYTAVDTAVSASASRRLPYTPVRRAPSMRSTTVLSPGVCSGGRLPGRSSYGGGEWCVPTRVPSSDVAIGSSPTPTNRRLRLRALSSNLNNAA
jgi:hypothetical protein